MCSLYSDVYGSGGGLMVIHWTADQEEEVVDSNSIRAEINSLRVYPANSVKLVPAFGGCGPPHSAGT